MRNDMFSQDLWSEERMDTTQDFDPAQAGQRMLELMGAAALWWAWLPWAAWLPRTGQPEPPEPVGHDDDLTRIEGIGPRIAALLRQDGITGYAALAAAPADRLEAVLAAAGPRFRLAQPATWPEQAALLAAGDEAGFAALAARLKGGVRR